MDLHYGHGKAYDMILAATHTSCVRPGTHVLPIKS